MTFTFNKVFLNFSLIFKINILPINKKSSQDRRSVFQMIQRLMSKEKCNQHKIFAELHLDLAKQHKITPINTDIIPATAQ